MFRLTALVVVTILYIIPLNIPLYHISELLVSGILVYGPLKSFVTAVIYVLFGLILFTAVYFTIKLMAADDKVSDNDKKTRLITIWEAHSSGQKLLNIASTCIILLLMLIHTLLMVFDIKLIVMAVLCVIFIYRQNPAQ